MRYVLFFMIIISLFPQVRCMESDDELIIISPINKRRKINHAKEEKAEQKDPDTSALQIPAKANDQDQGKQEEYPFPHQNLSAEQKTDWILYIEHGIEF